MDSSVGGSSSSGGLLSAARLEGQAMCKAERLQGLSTPLGPFDKNYSRKRQREHSQDRTQDCESQLLLFISIPRKRKADRKC